MRIGAKIMLNAGLDAARDGLASLAEAGWLMSLPLRQEARHGHPAGCARAGLPAPGSGNGLVAVTFGALPVVPGAPGVLPVHWESVEPGDMLAVLLAGDITPAAATPGGSTLTLAGFCRLLPAGDGGYGQARLEAVKEAARLFITDVGAAVTPFTRPGQEPLPLGPAWAWLTGHRSAP
jgi:hypothetical protein